MSTTNEPGYVPPDISLVGPEHVRRYQASDGADGYVWNGVNCLVLTTRGRRTHEARHNALIYGQDGDDYLVIASNGGAPQHPSWYLNVAADPAVEVQVLGAHIPATAHTATGEERERLWAIMTGIWPNYDVYTTRTTREIPLVVLRPNA